MRPTTGCCALADARALAAFAVAEQVAQTGGLLAIDGRCASGKSTLAARIGAVYGCPVFHMDDYFLPAELRTAERFAEPGGNVHRERVEEEILRPSRRAGRWSIVRLTATV